MTPERDRRAGAQINVRFPSPLVLLAFCDYPAEN